MIKSSFLILFALIIIFPSCENSKFDSFDINLNPPFLIEAKLDKYHIDSDTIFVNGQFSQNDTITITNKIEIKITDKDGLPDISFVRFVLRSPDNRDIFSKEAFDDGANGDLVAKDGIFTSKFSFKVPRILTGAFTIESSSEDKSRLKSNSLITSFLISRLSQTPVISELIAPDSITLPLSGSKIIPMSITARDPNGQGDIKEVYFRSLDSSDPLRKFFLLDNGNPANGDSIAGDGIYSIKIELPSSMTPKPYRFEFEAQDFTGLLSNKILHVLNVKRP